MAPTTNKNTPQYTKSHHIFPELCTESEIHNKSRGCNLKFYRITKQSYKIKVMTQTDPRERINPVVHFVIKKKAATLVKKK